MFDLVSVFDNNYLVENIDGTTVISIPLPGVTKEDLEIEAGPASLDIRVAANRKLPFLSKRKWRFTHRLGNPEVSAKVENGVLVLKLSETSRSKYRIEVA